MRELTKDDVVEIQTFEYKTLRDEFAMAALTGILANPDSDKSDIGASIDAFGYADAMMKARKVRDEE